MATSVWSEVAYLSCEKINEQGTYNLTLVVDTKKQVVTWGGVVSKYWEVGTEIRYVADITNADWLWSLDKISGNLYQEVPESKNFERPRLSTLKSDSYTCTRTDPLF